MEGVEKSISNLCASLVLAASFGYEIEVVATNIWCDFSFGL